MITPPEILPYFPTSGSEGLASNDQMNQKDSSLTSSSNALTRNKEQNVGGGEKIVSLAAGSILAMLGLRRRSIPGLMMAAVGTALTLRGATGHCSVYKSLGVDTAHGK